MSDPYAVGMIDWHSSFPTGAQVKVTKPGALEGMQFVVVNCAGDGLLTLRFLEA